MTDADPITLKEACARIFHGAISPATLRAEAARGRLDLFRIGKRDFTTVTAVRDMIERCRVEHKGQGSISTRGGRRGLSETARASSALDALNKRVMELKSSLHSTSPKSTSRKMARTL